MKIIEPPALVFIEVKAFLSNQAFEKAFDSGEPYGQLLHRAFLDKQTFEAGYNYWLNRFKGNVFPAIPRPFLA